MHSKGFLSLLNQRFCVHRFCLLSHDSTDCFLFLCNLCRSLAVAASFLEIVFPYLVYIFANSRAQLFEFCWVVQRGDQPVWCYPHPCKTFDCGEKKWPAPAFSRFRDWTAKSDPQLIKLSFSSTMKPKHTPLTVFVALPFWFELDPVSALLWAPPLPPSLRL